MKRWDCNINGHVEVPEIDKFLSEIDSVCQKHKLSISHEDGHGSFVIEPYSDYYREWLDNADVGDGKSA